MTYSLPLRKVRKFNQRMVCKSHLRSIRFSFIRRTLRSLWRECKALSLYDTGIMAEYGDKLITLSTCEYSRKNGRMVVVAKRIAAPSAEVGGDEA